MTARIGTAPDSWGVWYPDDARQVHWSRFLDEAARAGYDWIELGPFGYLPTDAAVLRDETAARGLGVAAATMAGPLHRPDGLDAIWARLRDVATLAVGVGGMGVVFIPESYRDGADGNISGSRALDTAGWACFTHNADELGRRLADGFGLRLLVHPHVETHLETEQQVRDFLRDTDPAVVGLCLDTGHIAYRNGDVVALASDHPDRVWYVHLKQVDPSVLAQVDAEGLDFGEAVRRDVMCEPPTGLPTMDDLRAMTGKLAKDIFVVVEQDMFPCPPERPLPIAIRTRRALREAGIG
jgi:inosose dehydratase